LTLDWQENTLRHELEEKRLLTGNRAERLVNFARSFRDFVRKGWAEISSKPDTPEQAERQLKFKKTIVQAIVTKVKVHADKTISIEANLALSEESAKVCNVDRLVRLRYNANNST
jgi:hypothetical protein